VHRDLDPRKTWTNRNQAEALHQMLHQIAESTKRDGLELLVEVLANSLDPTSLERLTNALSHRMTKK
jgi:hypothetical protein